MARKTTEHEGTSRRGFMKAAGCLVLGAGFSSHADMLKAQGREDDHFFLFVELKGGVHWLLATDGRDPNQIPLKDPRIVLPYAVDGTKLSFEDFVKIHQTDRERRRSEHGEFLLLPYRGDIASSYRVGRTTLGAPYCMGFAAEAFYRGKAYCDDVAVVRGVHMTGGFHGSANLEIFSGSFEPQHHVAGVLAQELAKRHGGLLLDNFVLENAEYNVGVNGQVTAPIKVDGEALGYLVKQRTSVTGGKAPDQSFAHARRLAEAITGAAALGPSHREVFDSYLAALGDADHLKRQLTFMSDALDKGDISVNLKAQVDIAIRLFTARLSRVVTICLGAENGRNKVDPNGMFDAHREMFHPEDKSSRDNTARHYVQVALTFDVLTYLIDKLKTTRLPGSAKSLWEQTTVVVSSEFGRPSNFAGNEQTPSLDNKETAFGMGHYQQNNNYILMGKGIRGGAWIGRNDPIRQTGGMFDMPSLERATSIDEFMRVPYTPVEFELKFLERSVSEFEEAELSPDCKPIPPPPDRKVREPFIAMKNLKLEGDSRPIMARDLVKTILTAAGLEASYPSYYSASVADARVLRSILSGQG